MRDWMARREHGSLRLRRRDRGAAAVEFALLVVPLFLLVFGGIDFGLALQQRAAVSEAARAAARAASLGADTAHIETVAKAKTDDTVTVTIDCLSAAGDTCTVGQAGNVGSTVRVTVTLIYHGVTGVFPQLISVPLTASSTMVVES